MKHRLGPSKGFTIVELLVVIVVIAILASIIIVSYNGITKTARETVLKSDLRGVSQLLTVDKVNKGEYPSDISSMQKSEGTTLNYRYNNVSHVYCVSASNAQLQGTSYYVTQDGVIENGVCPPLSVQDGDLMQAISTANCPVTRTMVVDSRDGNSYWIQRLADNRCWMLTNLAYAGDGANGYGDTKALQNGTSDPSPTYTLAKYYVLSGYSNPTQSPSQPSLSVDGGATGAQYGYFYNWCAALGAQLSTSACTNTATPLPDVNISVCPAGWRLPTGGSGGELSALTSALGAPNNSTGATVMRNIWLAQYAGNWFNGHTPQSYGFFWSSTQASATQGNHLGTGPTNANPAGSATKNTGFSVRCVAV